MFIYPTACPEVFRIADRITILRDGKKVLTTAVHELSASTVAAVMIGRNIEEFRKEKNSFPGGAIPAGGQTLPQRFFFTIYPLEHAGERSSELPGSQGRGRTEFGRCLCGIDPFDAGRILVHGQRIPRGSYRKCIKNGMIYLSEDRKNDGIFAELPIGQNILSTVIDKSCRKGIFYPGQT